jgi:hypothetical protein
MSKLARDGTPVPRSPDRATRPAVVASDVRLKISPSWWLRWQSSITGYVSDLWDSTENGLRGLAQIPLTPFWLT